MISAEGDRTWKGRLEQLKAAVRAGMENCKNTPPENRNQEICKLRILTQLLIEKICIFIDRMSENPEFSPPRQILLLFRNDTQTKLPKLELPKF